MPIKNNNESIRLYFTFNCQLYTMSKLGNWDDANARNTATQILAGIKNDISLGKFNCKDSKELFKQYHPLSELIDTQRKAASSVDCLTLVEQRIKEKPLRDKTLEQVVKFLKRYGKPVRSANDATQFFDWLKQNSKGKAVSINRYINAIKPICPYFADIGLTH